MGPPTEARASAPGKVILFGEHAVVYGEPSLSLALDRRFRLRAATGAKATTVNHEPLDLRKHAYLAQALTLYWGDAPLRITTESDLPSAGGVGSSAALSVCTTAAALRLRTGQTPSAETVARGAFEAEYVTQGAASPNDTSVSTAGGAVLLSPTRAAGATPLWRIERGDRAWTVQRVELEPVPLVVATTGTRSHTAEQVAKVKRLVEREPAAREAVSAIGRLTLDGVDAIRAGDFSRAGRLMNRNHELLHALGVDTPELARLAKAARAVPGTFGAKLTGAGGGGSLVVLTEKAPALVRAFEDLGVRSFAVRSSPDGFEVTS